MEYNSKILMNEFVTHNVRRFVVEKPERFKFTPGQATYVSINKEGWRKEKRPFTFTSLNKDLVLEFTIKEYPEHEGVTERLHELEPGEEIIVREPFGTIHYEDQGVFIAGGAGVTPFIAIIRMLKKEGKLKGNKLIFSNKTRRDVILEKEFREYFLSEDLVLTLTREKVPEYEYGRINEEFLRERLDSFKQNFYVCGPKAMVKDIRQYLEKLGAGVDSIVFESSV